VDAGATSSHVLPPLIQTEPATIPSQPGIGSLRQAIAERLKEYGDPKILRTVFTIYMPPRTGDLGTFPSAFRGSITGEGELGFEITIIKSGEFSKGQVETLAESLPNIKNADYSAKLEIQIKQEEE